MRERNLERAEKIHARLQHMLERRKQSQATGIAALQRLLKVAQGDSGQSRVAGRFLLGLYNSYAYPFSLIDFRRLDPDLHDDCLAVLKMDHAPAQEVHCYFKDGDRIWRELAATWGRSNVR